MRTTAVYGSGKFGAAARETIEDRPELLVPFQAELLTVYLIRTFVRDLLQHMANVKGGEKTAVLNPDIARSLILEPYPELVDGLSHCMADSNRQAYVIDGSMDIGTARELIEGSFNWALDIDWTQNQHCARLWYVSEEKLEPRLGERFDEPLDDYEQPLAPARDAALAYHAMASWDSKTRIAEFLLQHPEHRHILRRAQMWQFAPYGEIHDNTISESLLPIDMLRAKLSFFGATRFDPRSDRWVRICMYAGAPYPEDLPTDTADLWMYPELAS